MRKISKLLSIVLCLSLVMGLAIVAHAADLSGTYILADTMSDGTEVAGKTVSESKNYGYLYTTEITTDNERIQYTIAKSGSSYTITDCYGRALGVSGDYASFQFGESGDAILWNITVSGDKYIVTNVSNGKTVDLSDQYTSFGIYAEDKIPGDGKIMLVPVTASNDPEQSAPALEIVSVKTALDGNTGDDYKVKGVVTLVDGKNVYVQDETGAICVRMGSEFDDIALGDTIIGTGSRADYNGLPQLGSGTYEKSEGYTLSAKEVTIASATTSDICTYVKLTGLTVTAIDDGEGTYQYPNVTLSDGENEIQLYKGVVDGIAVGDKVNISCAMSCYNENLQLRNTSADEITPYVDTPADDTTDEPADDTTDEPADDTTDEPTDAPADDTTDEPTDAPTEGTDEPAEDEEPIPGTGDISVLAAALVGLCATAALVVVTKKEQ